MKATLLSLLLVLVAPFCAAQAVSSSDPAPTLQLAALDGADSARGQAGYNGPPATTEPSLLTRHRTGLGLGLALLLAVGLVAHRRRPAQRLPARGKPAGTAPTPRSALVPMKRADMPTVCEGFMLSQFKEVDAPRDAPLTDPLQFDPELRRARPAARKPLPAQRARRQALRPQQLHKPIPPHR